MLSNVRPRVSGSVARTTKNATHTTATYSTHVPVAPSAFTSGMNEPVTTTLATSLAAAPEAAPTLLASDGNTSALTTYGIGAMLAEKLSLNTRIPSTAIYGAHACPTGLK